MPARLVTRLLVPWLVLLAVLGTASAVARQPEGTGPLEGVVAEGPATTASPTTATTATTLPAETTTTTVAPTTTAAPPPAPTTTAAPRPRPTTTTEAPAPAPAPAATTAPAPAASATAEYALSLLGEVIPARWLQALPVTVSVITGKTSWSSWGGRIEIGDWHLTSSPARARSVLAHEWGHQVAWHYGTDAYNGAPPAGFPYDGPLPEEMWADCVANALTGVSHPSHGLGGCPGAALAFTSSFLAAGPGPRLR